MLIIRDIEQLYELTGLKPTDFLHFRRPTAPGQTKDYKISVVNFANALAQSLETDINQLTLDVSNTSIVVDFADTKIRNYKGNQNVGINHIWTLLNDENALSFVVFLNITSLIQHTFQFPVAMQSFIGTDEWDSVSKIWSPQTTGEYEMRFDWSGDKWLLKIFGSF